MPRPLALASLTLVAACGRQAAAPPPTPAPADAVVAAASAADDAGPPSPPPDASPPPSTAPVPTQAKALGAWLVSGDYRTWAHESEPHPSEGPHGSEVKTFLSPTLVASLERGAGEHPRGAAAVKELYDERGRHVGWAVSVKIADRSRAGKGWYWYEVFSTDPGAKPDYAGVGVKLCRGCHAEDSVDQVLITFPLE
jgi:hypothetical protein